MKQKDFEDLLKSIGQMWEIRQRKKMKKSVIRAKYTQIDKGIEKRFRDLEKRVTKLENKPCCQTKKK